MTTQTTRDDRAATTLRVGYLHLGDPRHGVCRYGRQVAAAVSATPDVQVTEIALDADVPTAALKDAAGALGDVDVIHIQYNRALWGDGVAAAKRIEVFLRATRPPVVASLHDVYPEDPWEAWKKRPKTLAKRIARWRSRRARQVPTVRALRAILRDATRGLVCFEEERSRLRAFRGADRLRVVGHFIEPVEVPTRSAARAGLGLDDDVVLTVLGFIHPRKGYDLMIDAFAALGAGYRCVFAGAPSGGNEAFLKKLVARADALGVRDRLTVTGFLPLAEQAAWIAATDLAVCPFRFLSASGSLATWIGAGRRILSHHTKQIEEYRAIAPGSLATFQPFEAGALAAAIEREARDRRLGPDPALAPLRERFSLARVAQDHIAIYEEAGRCDR